jgi:hypothetical protein
MLYSTALSPELLEKAAAASSITLQTQIGKCSTVSLVQLYHVTFINGTMIYFLPLNTAVNVLEVLILKFQMPLPTLLILFPSG